MKKNKILFPVLGLTTLAGSLPMVMTTTSCSNKNNVIPVSALNIVDGVLNGFKGNVDLSKYDTLSIPLTVIAINETSEGMVGPFCIDEDGDGLLDKSLIPENITNLVFEVDENNQTKCHIIPDYTFYLSPLKHVKIAQGVNYINKFAFSKSQVEDCYFPPFLRTIGEEAFSHTKLKRVEFNCVRENYSNLVPGKPWEFQDVGSVDGYSQTIEIGKKAFFDCKDLIYLKPSNSCTYILNDDGSIFTENGKSPFAVCDPVSGIPSRSNIKYLDLSNVWLKKDETINITDANQEPLSFSQAFGLDLTIIDDPESIGGPKNNFIIVQNKDWDYAQLNKLRTKYGMSEIESYKPALFGDWYFANSKDWGFDLANLDTTKDEPTITINQPDVTQVALSIRDKFVEFNTEKYPITVIPDDLEISIDNIKWDDGNYKGATIGYSLEEDGLKNKYINISWGRNASKLNGHTLTFEVTFKSEHLGYEYTFGPKIIKDSGGKNLFNKDTSVKIKFKM